MNDTRDYNFSVANHGAVVILTPLNAEAMCWIMLNEVFDHCPHRAGGIALEAGEAAVIIERLQREGARVVTLESIAAS